MKSLITGGAGFVGSHLADELIRAGDEVLVLDDLSTGHERNLSAAIEAGARLSSGDVSDRDFVEAEVSAFEPDRVFHLAAQVDVRQATEEPELDARINVLGTVNVLEAVRVVGGAPVVFAATGGAVYGEGEGRELPFAETAPAAPATAYGVSKLAGETYVAFYRRTHGIPTLSLRFGNIYGPRQDPHGEAGVVAIFCGRLLDGEVPTVYGDGLQTRDYVYVGDAVEALVAAAGALAEGRAGVEGPLNIGTGRESTVLALLDVLAPLAGTDPKPVHSPPRTGEVKRVALDPSKAADELGWIARVPLGEGLERTFSFMREQRARLPRT